MCDPTGISETAILGTLAASAASASAATAAGVGAAGGMIGATAMAGALPTLAAGTLGSVAAAGGLFGTGISASTALGVAGTAASMGLGMIGKGAQYADQNALYIQNAQNANIALGQTYNANRTRQQQEADKAQQDNFDVVKSMAEAKGKAGAAAGEAGVGGVSFSNVLSDYEMRTGNTVSKTNANYAMSNAQIQSEQYAAESRTKAAINSTPRPSELGMFAGMAGDAIKGGLKIYDIYNNNSPS